VTDKLKRIRFWGKLVEGSLTVLTVILLIIMLIILIYRQDEATQSRKDSDRTLKILLDCTTPNHDCYKESQKRTGNILREVDRVIILANYCSINNETLPAVEECVSQNLPH